MFEKAFWYFFGGFAGFVFIMAIFAWVHHYHYEVTGNPILQGAVIFGGAGIVSILGFAFGGRFGITTTAGAFLFPLGAYLVSLMY